MTVSLLDSKSMVEKALAYQEQGFMTLKIKLGDASGARDVHRMEMIRSAIQDHIALTIDANQGWTYQEAMQALYGMAQLNIKYCEAPIRSTDIYHLRSIRRKSPIPIMGDESVFDHHDAMQRLIDQSIDLVNIKLGKAGGICQAMKIASITDGLDVECQVGCFSESRLGISALAHFALAWPHIKYYDMDSPLMHAEDPVIGGLEYKRGGHIHISDTPGHGADYDKKFLASFESITIRQ